MPEASQPPPEFRLTYNCGLKDFGATQRLYMGTSGDRNLGRNLLFLVAGVGAVVAILFIAGAIARYLKIPFRSGDPAFLYTLLFLSFAYTAWCLQRRGKILEGIFNATPFASHPVELTAGPRGLESKCGPVNQIWSWTGLKSVGEHGEHIRVLYSDRFGELIPVSAFPSTDEKERFLSIVRNNIEQNAQTRTSQ